MYFNSINKILIRCGFKKCLTQLKSKNYSTKAPKQEYEHKIFSGIQPTGAIHLGNYFGAVAQWIKLQEEQNNMLLSIVDLHSMTLPHDPKELRKNIIEMAATLLGCGIDTEKVLLFQQSAVPAHTQLCWSLGCVSTMARLAHLPTYKEKSAALKDIPFGLFAYPVLQAADILAYKATHVPVGEDQFQNIELTRELAKMFNKRFGETFPIPTAILTGKEYSRLKSFRDPVKKMSKSDPDPKSRICLTDSPDSIVKVIKKAVTDFTSEVTYDPELRPGVANLISIHSFVTNKSVEDICEEAKGFDTAKYKLVVAEAVVEYLKPIQRNINDLLKDEEYVIAKLRIGGERAAEIADQTLDEVYQKLGLQINVQSRCKAKIRT